MTKWRFAIAAESERDARRVSALVDRLLVARVEWLPGHDLDTLRSWTGLDDSAGFFDLHSAPAQVRARGVRLHGRFDGRHEERLVRGILILFHGHLVGEPPAALVICRDLDGDDSRRTAAERALRETATPFPVALALPQPEIEAWWLAGFTPETDDERAALNQLRRELGFDPAGQPHRLSSTSKSKKDAKRVLLRLTAERDERLEACVASLLSSQPTHGEALGWNAFVADIEEKLVPLLASPSA